MKKLILIGGGNLANKENKAIHQYMLNCCKTAKPRVLYVPVSPNEKNFILCMKDYNCEVLIYHDNADIDLCDIIYIGGGNTSKFIEKYKENGFIQALIENMDKKIIVGMSAGAIFWFKKYYSDLYVYSNGEKLCNYRLLDGIGYFDGYCCPHYNHNGIDTFNDIVDGNFALALEDNTALAIDDENIDIIKENKSLAIYYFIDNTLYVLNENNKKEFFKLIHEREKKIS